MNAENLCVSLAEANSEDEVVRVLKEAGYWDDETVWTPYGGNDNNFATIGNQQSSPEAALVEKLVNSVDAVLMRECLKRGLHPESEDAPQSVREALEEFFNVRHGLLSNVPADMRAGLASNILLVATGTKSNPCYSIIDRGEGQTPNSMPLTILSLPTGKSNKLKIPFVQGKFNMGSTGALQFCKGHHNFQLIISKRDPAVSKLDSNDSSREEWSFTIVRRINPSHGYRSSRFMYLAPEGRVLRFKSDSLPLLPGEYPEPMCGQMQSGTYVKLYEYDLPGGLKGPIMFDMYYRLGELLPTTALPILCCERRKGYTGHTYQTVLSGLTVRLEDDRYENIEPGFPCSSSIRVRDENIDLKIYAFKEDKKRRYADDGVIFIINGQTHGFFSRSFFDRAAVGMNYLSDSILILADCSSFSPRVREDLFMNSRDRLRDGDIRREIEKALETVVSENPGLRELRARRRKEQMQSRIGNAKPLADALEKAIRKSPTLSRLFIKGETLTNPFAFENGSLGSVFNGKEFPSFFRLKKNYDEVKPKNSPINRRFRVQFETDARNDYFFRDDCPGEFSLHYGDNPVEDYTLTLWNGCANLTAKLPLGCSQGQMLTVKTSVNDDTRVDPFKCQFTVKIGPPVTRTGGNENGHGPADPPGGDEDDETRKKPSGLSLPEVVEVRQSEWPKHSFDRESALKVVFTGVDSYDFYVNMDNVYLLTEIKGRTGEDHELLEAQYKYALVMLGISLLRMVDCGKNAESDEQRPGIYEQISVVGRAVSPIILPMLTSLGNLDR